MRGLPLHPPPAIFPQRRLNRARSGLHLSLACVRQGVMNRLVRNDAHAVVLPKSRVNLNQADALPVLAVRMLSAELAVNNVWRAAHFASHQNRVHFVL